MFDITFWCSIAGVAVSLIGIIIMFMTRNNILDILDKDIILFEKNFDIKMNAVTKALNLADEVANFGKEITRRPDFEEKAKEAYNDLMCIATNTKVVDEFYSIALDPNVTVDSVRITKFKLLCRKDIGLKAKHSKALKQQNNAKDNMNSFNSYSQPRPSQPVNPAPVRPVARPSQPAGTAPARPMARPAARPTTPVRKPDDRPKA